MRRELVARDLAEGVAHRQVRQVEIFLVHDRRDARVDLEQAVADELDVDEPVETELAREPVGGRDELGPVDRLEPHREAGAHRLARLRVAEHEPAVAADAVDRVLGPVDELHDEQRREVLGTDRVERLLDRERQRPGARLEQRPAAVDVRGEDAEAARALGGGRLHADVVRGVAERLGGRPELVRRASRGGSRARRRRRDARPRWLPTCPGSARPRRRPRPAAARRSARGHVPGRAPRTSSSAARSRRPRGVRDRRAPRRTTGRRRAARRGTRRTGSGPPSRP